jgi:Tripartite tricarboxylate transporter family receptor
MGSFRTSHCLRTLFYLGMPDLKHNSASKSQSLNVLLPSVAPALADLAAGHIQMMFCDVPPAQALIQAGKIRALGVTTLERVKPLPEVPPLAEVGMCNFTWHLSAGRGEIVQKIAVDRLLVAFDSAACR